jgi:hypothetical protein
MALRYQMHASLGGNGLEKDTSVVFREVFREQFLCYAQLLNARREAYYMMIYRYSPML